MLDVYLIRLQKTIPAFRKTTISETDTDGGKERGREGRGEKGKERNEEQALKHIIFQSVIPKQCCVIV